MRFKLYLPLWPISCDDSLLKGHKPNKGALVSLAICLSYICMYTSKGASVGHDNAAAQESRCLRTFCASMPPNRLSLSPEQRRFVMCNRILHVHRGCSHLSGCRPTNQFNASHGLTRWFPHSAPEGKPQTKRLQMFPTVCRVEFQLATLRWREHYCHSHGHLETRSPHESCLF